MIFSLVVILLANLLSEYEVGMQYSYFYKADTKLVSAESDDQETNKQPLIFSCLATIICTSANARGHEFLLKLTGIHLTLEDPHGKVLNDFASLQVDRNYSKPFIFSILRSGAIANVKASKDEPDEILTIKTGIIGLLISVSENEINSPVETIDNQGLYMSHWQNKTTEENTVELSRHFTDEDFIHFLNPNVDHHSFVLNVTERKKIKAGIINEVVSENTLLVAGKRLANEKRKVAHKYKGLKDQQRMYNGRKVDEYKDQDIGELEQEYEGTEIFQQTTATLSHINTKPLPEHLSLGSARKILRELRGSFVGLDESNGDDESDESDELQWRSIVHFNRKFYASRAETQMRRKPSMFQRDLNRNRKSTTPSSLPPPLKRLPDLAPPKGVNDHYKHSDRVRPKGMEKEWFVQEREEPSKGRSLGKVHWDGKNFGDKYASAGFFKFEGPDSYIPQACTDIDHDGIGEGLKHQEEFNCDEGGDPGADEPEDSDEQKEKDQKNAVLLFCEPGDDFFEDFDDKKDQQKQMDDLYNQVQNSKPPKPPPSRTEEENRPIPPGSRNLTSTSPSWAPEFEMVGGGPMANGLQKDTAFAGKLDCDVKGVDKCIHYGAYFVPENDNWGFFANVTVYAGYGGDIIDGFNFLLFAGAELYVKLLGFKINIITMYLEYGFVNNFPKRNAAAVEFLFFDAVGCKFKDYACRKHEIDIPFPKGKEPKASVEYCWMFLIAGIIPLQLAMGVQIQFKMSFFIDACLWNGSLSVGLEPKLLPKGYASVSVAIGFWKFKIEGGLRITVGLEVSLIPEVGLVLGAAGVFFTGTLEISPLTAALEIYYKIWKLEGSKILWKYSFGGWTLTIFDLRFTLNPSATESFRLGMDQLHAFNADVENANANSTNQRVSNWK